MRAAADQPDAMEILDPTYRAAAILFARGIYVEPCRRLIPQHPIVYLACWPDGERRHLSETELLTLAGAPAGQVSANGRRILPDRPDNVIPARGA
jgi:hypothetical protein